MSDVQGDPAAMVRYRQRSGHARESFTIDFRPVGNRLLCKEPIVLFDAAKQAGVFLNAVCGGNATCGKCLVQVSGGPLSPVTALEQQLLSEAEITAGYRLACRTLVSGDASVYQVQSSPLSEHELQVEGVEDIAEIDPTVLKFFIAVSPATLADPRSDFERTGVALREQTGIALDRADVASLNQLCTTLRASQWTVTVTHRRGELICTESGDKTSTALGLAVDLGSTKIACYLVDLLTGQTLAALAILNPQIAYGEDIIARIEAANRAEGTRKRLREIVASAINLAAANLCASKGVAPSEILEITVVGNTAMHHLFLGLPVRQLGVIPFVPVSAEPADVKCPDLGLVAAPGAYVHFPPPIAGFVGSDHVAALLASHFGEDDRTRLLIDLGTNTELALQTRGDVYSCSTACGPAFEGAHIKFGMRAAPGAIEHVRIDRATREVELTTVGGKRPVGICGSGILDAVAELVRLGWIDERGRLGGGALPLRSVESGAKELVLSDVTAADERQVVLSQKDLSQVQLAKGAIRAGIDLLMGDASLAAADLDEVIVAGAFGTYLDPGNAVRLGLFPPVPLDRFCQAGNAAGIGAKRVLLSRSARVRAARIAKQVKYVELSLHPRFAESFVGAMLYRGETEHRD